MSAQSQSSNFNLPASVFGQQPHPTDADVPSIFSTEQNSLSKEDVALADAASHELEKQIAAAEGIPNNGVDDEGLVTPPPPVANDVNQLKPQEEIEAKPTVLPNNTGLVTPISSINKQQVNPASSIGTIQVPENNAVKLDTKTSELSTVKYEPVVSNTNSTPPVEKPIIDTTNPDSADTIITKSTNHQSILAVLQERKLLSDEQVDAINAESAMTGKKTEDLIAEQNLVSEDQLTEAKAAFFNVERIVLEEVGVSPEALNQVPEGVARRYQLMPFSIDAKERVLKLAMVNPLDLRAIDFVEKKSGYRVTPYLTTATELHSAVSDRYSQSLSTEVSAALKETSDDRRKVVDVTKLGEVIREAPIAKIVETVLTFAMKSRASDVHIEPQEDKTRIRYRIDGILHEKLVLPKGVHDAVVSRIKILADMKIDEKRIPQDGRFSFRVGVEEVDLRVSSLPTVHGEKIVMRLLKKAQRVPSLQDLGFRGVALKSVEDAITVPHGIILVTGPTGSGKTTTLYSVLHKVNTPKVNIVTLEDPVEYEMVGVNQVQINPLAGLTFASGLRSFLRQDPNIIMVGEIRDQETADLAVQASLTGHLVFSTLHTNSAAGALPRLLDMKVESYLLASSMTLVVGQRVVRKICDGCKAHFDPEPPVLEDIKAVLGPLYQAWLSQQAKDTHPQLSKGEGCTQCNNTGYVGRVGIYEVLRVTEKIGRLILERAPGVDIEKAAMLDGMMLMKQDGYLKVLEGITTIEEVLRVAEI